MQLDGAKILLALPKFRLKKNPSRFRDVKHLPGKGVYIHTPLFLPKKD